MNNPIRLLMVEDSEPDAVLVLEELRRAGYTPDFERVTTARAFLKALDSRKWDFIIADYSLPGFGGMPALSLLRERGLDLPFIIVSGTIGEDQAVAAMKSGAHDYLLKGKLARLAPAVERELRDARVRRERQEAEQDLRTSREQLRALAAHLLSVREEERKLIAREIHDELGQSLTGFKMDLAWIRHRLQPGDGEIDRQPLLDKINEMGTLIDGSANLIRKLCTELRPGILDDLGLVPAVEWQAREFQKRTGIECALKLEVAELNLDPERSTALFRIFQEILTNVARHAAADRVTADLRRTGDELILEVRDNGKGIEPARLSGEKSLGLLGMRERALLFGGQVFIEGKKGRGTTVTVTIPMLPSPAAPKTTKSAGPRSPRQPRIAR
ncbi:MAG TPA: ATP-binding protein [Verrucomicrobiae bacterium]|nr:ATP-binding protein [Verrucomicrobiae bacterium]